MGKLRFTLTYVLFWVIIVFSCFLTENFALFSNERLDGNSVDTIFLLTLFVIFLLAFYYFKEHRKNQLTFDKILLPIIVIFGLFSILTIIWQGPRTFTNPDDGFETSVKFNALEKASAILQVVVWCGVLYALLFAANRYSITRKWLKWLGFVYVIGVLGCTLADVIYEFPTIVEIFKSEYTGNGLRFIIYNENVWGHIILTGLLTCVILNIKRFKLFYYLVMFHFFIVILFTSCASAFFVGITVILLYTFYEIISRFKNNKKYALKLLIIYLGSLLAFFGLLALMVALNVPMFVNFWSFVSNQILKKDYHTLTSRTYIWGAVFKLLSQNPIDLIFGLGYKTGNAIFTQYYLAMENHNFAIRSTHNGFVEFLLRHGIIGILFYLAGLSAFVVGIVRLMKKKQYRVAYFYTICVCGILAHGFAESTQFFTPNISGTYYTMLFLLPIINVTKEKHYLALNESLQQEEIEEVNVDKQNVLYFVNTMIMGIVIALSTTLLIRFATLHQPTMIVYLVLLGFALLSLLVAPIVAIVKYCLKAKEAFASLLLIPFVDNYIALGASALIGLLMGFVLPQLFNFELITTIVFSIFVFCVYIFTFSLFVKKENCPLYYFFNTRFTGLLKKVSSEGPNE